jgi:voltage-gated sodium channel
MTAGSRRTTAPGEDSDDTSKKGASVVLGEKKDDDNGERKADHSGFATAAQLAAAVEKLNERHQRQEQLLAEILRKLGGGSPLLEGGAAAATVNSNGLVRAQSTPSLSGSSAQNAHLESGSAHPESAPVQSNTEEAHVSPTPSAEKEDRTLLEKQGALGGIIEENDVVVHVEEGVQDAGTKIPTIPVEFHGKWADSTGSFYAGTFIDIDGVTWQPEDPPSAIQKTAVYTMEVLSPTRCMLIETRMNSEVRKFIACSSHNADTIQVLLEANQSMQWTLHRAVEVDEEEERKKRFVPLSRQRSLLRTDSGIHQKSIAERVVDGGQLDMFISIVIMANSVCIGLQTSLSLGEQGRPSTEPEHPVLSALENIFLAIYVVELSTRLWAKGKVALTDRWFLFDLFLVVTGVLYLWCYTHVASNTQDGGQDGSVVEQVLVFRLLRLMRLLRAFRLVPQLQIAWRLVWGMLTSMWTMASTLALLALMLYLFACVGVEVITKDPALWEAHPDLLHEKFISLEKTIATLFQFVAMDSVSDVYTPLIEAKPSLLPFFVLIVMTIPVVLMNLVTAVIVESALDQSNQDKELARLSARKQVLKLRPILEKFFDHVKGESDLDCDDMLKEQLCEFSIDDLPHALLPYIKVENMQDLFELLDADCSGSIDKREFVDGLLGFTLDTTGKASTETILMLKALRLLGMLYEQVSVLYAQPHIKPVSATQGSDHHGGALKRESSRMKSVNPVKSHSISDKIKAVSHQASLHSLHRASSSKSAGEDHTTE